MSPEFTKKFTNPSSFPTPGKGATPGMQDQKPVRVISLQFVIGTIVFLGTIIAVGVLIGLGVYYDNRIESISNNIEEQKEVFLLETIQTLSSFDQQISSFKDVVIERSVFLPIINTASAIVSPRVVFESLTVFIAESGTYRVEIEAEAISFADYLQQVRILTQSENPLSGGKVTSFSIQQSEEDGNTVIFSYEKEITDIDRFVQIGNT